MLATQLELAAGDGVEVLTERECRRREAPAKGVRFSVEVLRSGPRNDRRRWPDLVVVSEHGMRAVEIEFAPKGRKRLQVIVAAYRRSRHHEVVFLVKSAALRRTIVELARLERGFVLSRAPTEVTIAAWDAVDAERVGALVAPVPAPVVRPPAAPRKEVVPAVVPPPPAPVPVVSVPVVVEASLGSEPEPAKRGRWLRRRAADSHRS